MALEAGLLRTLYARDHLSQVLATFALILILNDGVKMIFGNDLPLSAPEALSGPVELLPGLQYPAYRLLILGVGLALALLLWLLVQKTRMGALVRAGASNREMATAMGTDIPRLFTIVFGIGAALCAVAGALLGPLLAVQVGMGENILILAFVVIVIGGIGSIRGALVGAILVGAIDTLGRTVMQAPFAIPPPQMAIAAGPAVAGRDLRFMAASWRSGRRPVPGAADDRVSDARHADGAQHRPAAGPSPSPRSCAPLVLHSLARLLRQPAQSSSSRSPLPASTWCSATAAWSRLRPTRFLRRRRLRHGLRSAKAC